MPEKECPTRTVGPSCRASTRWAEATASGSVVNGFCTAVALSPAACNRAITSDQHDPSANSPCTRTTLRALIGAAMAAMPRADVNEAAAPAKRAAENVRLLIGMSISLQSTVLGIGDVCDQCAQTGGTREFADHRSVSFGAVPRLQVYQHCRLSARCTCPQ